MVWRVEESELEPGLPLVPLNPVSSAGTPFPRSSLAHLSSYWDFGDEGVAGRE